jgi:hypothetical protein
VPRADPLIALELWLRSNGAPTLVPRRSFALVLIGPFLLIGYMLRSLAEAVTRRGSAMLQVVPLLLVALTLPLVLTTLLFLVLAAAFATRQARPDLDELGQFADADELRAALPPRLANSLLADRAVDPDAAPTLRRMERTNLVVISVLAQVVTATVIAAVVDAFFIVLGIVTVDRGALVSWLGHGPRVVASWDIAGHEYLLTNELLRVSTFLGAFTGFYFIVTSSTDEALRAHLAAGHRHHVRACLAVRHAYWELLRG